METIRKVVNLGKINYNGTGKRYPVTVEIEVRTRGGEPTYINNIPTGETTPTYTEFSACGYIWNTTKTDFYCGGQCLDEIAKYLNTLEFKKVYQWWKKYHLNGMHSGTPDQEKALKDHFNGKKYDYTEACNYLKEIGLYTVNYSGKSIGKVFNNEPYTYGHAWIINDIPENELKQIIDFIKEV